MMGLEEFRSYCLGNKDYRDAESMFRRSQKLPELICGNPYLVDVRNVVEAYKGVILGDKKNPVGVIDVVFFDNDMETYLIECNSNRRGRKGERAERLDRAHGWVLDRFDISPLLLVVNSYNGKKLVVFRQTPPIDRILRAAMPRVSTQQS